MNRLPSGWKNTTPFDGEREVDPIEDAEVWLKCNPPERLHDEEMALAAGVIKGLLEYIGDWMNRRAP